MNVLTLNFDFTPINMVHWQKAIKLVILNKAEIIKYDENHKIYDNGKLKLFKPIIVRLLKYIKKIQYHIPPPTKENILLRDNFICCYCGKSVKKKMTIDHILPKSRGGKTTWMNCVTCCFECNNKRKGFKTPKEANLSMHFQPKELNVLQIIKLHLRRGNHDFTRNYSK